MTSLWSLLSVLACPLGMGLMMWFMMRGHTSGHERAQAHIVTPNISVEATRPSILRGMHLCINWKVIVTLLLVGLGIWAVAPGLVWGALPLLVLAACPLSMLVMAWGMRGQRRIVPNNAEVHHSDDHRAEARLAELRAQQVVLDRAIADLKSTRTSASDANMPVTAEVATHVEQPSRHCVDTCAWNRR